MSEMAEKGLLQGAAGIRSRLAGFPLLYGAAVLFLATSLVNAGNYLFNVIAGRALGPDTYGALTAVVSLLSIVSIPALTLQTMAAKEVADSIAAPGGAPNVVERHLLRLAAGLGAVVLGGFIVLSWPLERLMDIGSPVPVIIIGITAAFSIVTSVLRGTLQGRRAFGSMAFSIIVDPLVRIPLLVLLLVAGSRLMAGLIAYVVSGLVLYTVAAALLRALKRRGSADEVAGAGDGVKGLRLDAVLPYAFVVGISAALYNVDIVAARAGLPEHDAGLYAAGAVLGRAIFFVGAVGTMVMLPVVAQHAQQGQRHQHLLVQTLVFTLVLAGGALITYIFVPELVIRLAFGSQFVGLEENLRLLGTAMFLFAAANVAMHYLIAIGRWRPIALPVLFVAVAQLLLLAAFHETVREIALVQVAVMFGLNLATWPMVLRHVRQTAV